MREWIDELSSWMEVQEKVSSPLTELSEEVYQAALETDSLLQASDQLESVFATIIGKMENANSGR